MLRFAYSLIFALVAVTVVLGQQSAAMAADAKVHIYLYKAGFIVGVSGGKGTMTTEGKIYPLAIGGVSLGATLGLSKVELIGTAHNINDPSDIEGVYSGMGAGLAVAGGRRVARLTNSKGVILEVKGRQVGFMFSIDLSGLQIALKK